MINKLEEDEFGHIWDGDWEESDMPHPGFGGSIAIYGGYVDRCSKCGLYGYDFKQQLCEKKD